MWLRVATTTMVVFGIVALIWTFLLFGDTPAATAPKKEKAEYGLRLLTGFGVTAGAWVAAAGCAVALARRARKEFVEQEAEAMKRLIEGTLRDHESKRS
ncbi:MAG: hypothetical protein KF812_09250 [Fimbriimonadaceae bacterium]|nr:hypothetical protein [Fimbriimonadaceae bacterium]